MGVGCWISPALLLFVYLHIGGKENAALTRDTLTTAVQPTLLQIPLGIFLFKKANLNQH